VRLPLLGDHDFLEQVDPVFGVVDLCSVHPLFADGVIPLRALVGACRASAVAGYQHRHSRPGLLGHPLGLQPVLDGLLGRVAGGQPVYVLGHDQGRRQQPGQADECLDATQEGRPAAEVGSRQRTAGHVRVECAPLGCSHVRSAARLGRLGQLPQLLPLDVARGQLHRAPGRQLHGLQDDRQLQQTN